MIDRQMARDRKREYKYAMTRLCSQGLRRRSLFIEFSSRYVMLYRVIGSSLIPGDVKATPRISRDYTLRIARRSSAAQSSSDHTEAWKKSGQRLHVSSEIAIRSGRSALLGDLA